MEDVRSILKSGVSVDADEYNRSLFYKSKNYMTPLLCAASRGNSECVKELIAWGGAYPGLKLGGSKRWTFLRNDGLS